MSKPKQNPGTVGNISPLDGDMENPLAGDQRCGDVLARRQSIYRAYSTYTNPVAGTGDSNAAGRSQLQSAIQAASLLPSLGRCVRQLEG
jgi:hypothetical protein